jgi:hypothetical protein
MRYIVLIFTFLATSAAAEFRFFYDANVTTDYIKNLEVRVVLHDNATGACWTNLKEVREYAEEKLRTFGVKVSQTEYMTAEANIYWLNIIVIAQRLYKDGTGPCFGHYDITLLGWDKINGVNHIAHLGRWGGNTTISSSDNFNRPIIVALEKSFATFPK